MNNNRMELVIDGNASGANSEITKLNSAITSFEASTVRASKSSASALEQFEKTAGRVAITITEIAIAAKSVGFAVRELKALTVAAYENKSAAGGIVDTYRAARLSVAAFTSTSSFAVAALTVGAGILVEKLVGVANSQSKVIEGNAQIAAASKASFSSVQSFSTASKITSLDLTFLNSFPVDRVRSYVLELQKIADPIDRAARAQEIFGANAAKVYPLLNSGIERIIDASVDLTRKLDVETRLSVQRLRDDFDVLGKSNPFAAALQGFRQFREEAKQGIVVFVSSVADKVRNFQPKTPYDDGKSNLIPSLGGNGSFPAVRLQREFIEQELRQSLSDGIGQIGGGVNSSSFKLYTDLLGQKGSKQQIEEAKKISIELDSAKSGLEARLSEANQLIAGFAVQPEKYSRELIAAKTLKEQLAKKLEVFEIQEKADKAEKSASQLLAATYEAGLPPIQKIGFELLKNIKLYGLTEKALSSVSASANLALEQELSKESNKNFEAQQKNYREQQSDLAKGQLAAEAEALKLGLGLRNKTASDAAEYEIRAINTQRDFEIQQLELVGARTVDQKVYVEQQKAVIDEKYFIKKATLEAEALDQRAKSEIATFEIIARAQGVSDLAIALKRDAILNDFGQKGKQLDLDTQNAIEASRNKAQIESIKLVNDNTQKTFDSIKQSVGSLFDQLVTRSMSVFSVIGNLLKLTFLSAIKEVVSSSIATRLTALLAGNRAAGVGVSGSNGGIGGLLRLAGLGGALASGVPGAGALQLTQNSSGAFGFLTPQNAFQSFAGAVGGPGGTSGFAGPVAGAQGARGGLGSLGSLAVGGAGLSSLFFNSGSIALGGGSATTAAGIGGIGGGIAGAASSTAGLIGGGLLAFDGVKRRGGLLGFAEGIGGGALAGFALGAQIGAIGGPLGLLIGAAVGGAAVLIASLFKRGSDKAREKIKSVYGVDISAKNILDQIVAMAKQSYGGNLDVAIRSKDVQDLVELYALSTGQAARGLVAHVQPLTLSTSGGVSSILQNYSNGRPVNPVSAGSNGPAIIQVTLDAESSAAFLQGQTVNAIGANPRAVATANNVAQQSNFGRTQAALNQFSPGLLTA